jgi:HAMP domain-containing protein
LECIKNIYKHNIVKCPYDSIPHQVNPDNLPVNYSVLTALPMGQQVLIDDANKDPSVTYCDTHPSKKVKFFCVQDKEMFCSKCILKHTQMKHEVVPISHKIQQMKHMVKEMIDEVDNLDKNVHVNEDLYSKLEHKVRKKFSEEVEKLEKSFRRIMEQLEI